MSGEIDKLRSRKDSPSEETFSYGLFVQEEARLLKQLAELDQEQEQVEERAKIQQGRADGCSCLGVGGLGMLIAVLSDGLPIFEDYCTCQDGERVREAAAWANEAVEQQDKEDQRAETKAQQQERARDALTRAGIERRYEMCTFKNLRALLVARGFMTRKISYYLDRLEDSYGYREPLRGDYICGEPGHGKTSTGLSALRAWIERGRVGRFINEGDFLDRMHLGMGQRDGEGDTLLEYLKTVPLLVFDDLAMVSRSAYDRGKIVSLLQARHAASKLTIITSNFPISEASLRLSGEDRLEHGRLEGRLLEMCDEFKLVTGQLRTADRTAVPVQVDL